MKCPAKDDKATNCCPLTSCHRIYFLLEMNALIFLFDAHMSIRVLYCLLPCRTSEGFTGLWAPAPGFTVQAFADLGSPFPCHLRTDQTQTKTQTHFKKTSPQAYLVLKKCWKTFLNHDEQQRQVWILFPKWPMACFLWIPRIFAKHLLRSLILFSLRYDLLLLGKDNALNCGWLSYAERSTCAGKSSHQARPGYSASPKICTYCSSSQTGGGYAAYYRQCAGD